MVSQNHGNISTEPIFGERGFAATLSSGYFAMLGTLSKYPEGLKLMEKAKVFTLLYHLSDLRGRDDIITAAIENLDYHMWVPIPLSRFYKYALTLLAETDMLESFCQKLLTLHTSTSDFSLRSTSALFCATPLLVRSGSSS